MTQTHPTRAMNILRINYTSDLENAVPSNEMRELLDEHLYANVSDAVLTFLGDWGEVSFHEDDFTLETRLSKDQFIEKANTHDLFRKLGVKIRIE